MICEKRLATTKTEPNQTDDDEVKDDEEETYIHKNRNEKE